MRSGVGTSFFGRRSPGVFCNLVLTHQTLSVAVEPAALALFMEDEKIAIGAESGTFLERLESLDLRLMSAVATTATPGDCRALLALHLAVRGPGYTYLEIGSEQGGSLQAHLSDRWCGKVFSIDLRVATAPDFRGTHEWYVGNSTATMCANLARAFPNGEMDKLKTFDMKAADVTRALLTPAPSLIFVDAEHTDDAVFEDFLWALEVVQRNGWIAFHDAHLVCGGIKRVVAHLKSSGVPYSAGRVVESSVFAIALGEGAAERIASFPIRVVKPERFLRLAGVIRWRFRIRHWRLRGMTRLIEFSHSFGRWRRQYIRFR